MPARIIRPPCTRYQSECRLTVWRIASRIAWAAASSDMVMVRLHSTNVHQKILRRESAVLATLTRQMMTGVRWCMFLSQREVERFRLQLVAASRQRAKPLYRVNQFAMLLECACQTPDRLPFWRKHPSQLIFG